VSCDEGRRGIQHPGRSTSWLTLDNSVIDTLRPVQNKTGGFGGGHGQFSHLATTYASVLSLVMVGGEEALALIDRRAM